MKFLIKVIAASVAVWIVTLIEPLAVVVTGGEEWWSRVLVFAFVGLVLTTLNVFIKPLLKLLSLPLLILTLGLFNVIITWFVLYLTRWITEFVDFAELDLGSFWQTLFAALIIAVIAALVEAVLPSGRSKKD
jgi:putative membrane protein